MKKSPAEKEQGHSVEDIFRKGFSEAESAPPSRIWENVDRELENHDLHRYRRQVIWYRSMAAAFLFLLVSAGIILWQQDSALTGQEDTPLASSQEKVATPSVDADRLSTLAAKAPQKESRPQEPLRAVLGPFSGKRPQNSKVAARSTSTDAVPRRALTLEAKAPVEILARQSVNSQVPPETLVAEPVSGSAVQAAISQAEKGATGIKPLFPQSGEGKQFSRSLLNTLSLAKTLPSDSSKAAPERSILASKEATTDAVAETPSTAKGNEAEDTGVTRWSVTLAYSPQYAYAPVKIGNTSSVADAAVTGQAQLYQQYQRAVEEYNESYTPTYSYSTLVGASYKLNDKWQLETGLMYTQNEATTTQSYVVYQGGYAQAYLPGNMNNGLLGDAGKSAPLVASALNREAEVQPVVVNRTSQYNTRYRYQQVGLPLRVAYRLNIKKVYALFSGGVNMNLLVQNSIMPQTDQVEAVTFGFNDKASPYRALQWATTTSIGVGYDVTKKMSILVAPEFTYSLTPMVRESQQQENTYQLGVSIGGRWRLTK